MLIVTQLSHPNRSVKHDGYDRTGDWQTRVKITQDLEQEIDLGLQIYEENLWSQQQWVRIFHTTSTGFLAIFRNEITTILTPSTSEGGEWGR